MKNENSETLIRIMRDHMLTTAQVAELIGCSVSCVYHWRSDTPMPDRQLELLRLKLQALGVSST